jgi:hypothetical protein
MNDRPGWKTTEFWATAITQLLSILALCGFVSSNDSRTLEEAGNKIVVAIFLFVSNAAVVIYYIRSRLHVKTLNQQGDAPVAGNSVLDKFPIILVLAAAVPLLCLAPANARAGDGIPARALLPWREQMEQRYRDLQSAHQNLQGLLQRQAQPAPQPLQILLIPGEPKQALPIQGDPKHVLPIPGAPRQEMPIAGPPRQDLPPGGQPKQDLPLQPPGPIQQVPITPQNPQGPQQLSVYVRCLHRPGWEKP